MNHDAAGQVKMLSAFLIYTRVSCLDIRPNTVSIHSECMSAPWIPWTADKQVCRSRSSITSRHMFSSHIWGGCSETHRGWLSESLDVGCSWRTLPVKYKSLGLALDCGFGTCHPLSLQITNLRIMRLDLYSFLCNTTSPSPAKQVSLSLTHLRTSFVGKQWRSLTSK